MTSHLLLLLLLSQIIVTEFTIHRYRTLDGLQYFCVPVVKASVALMLSDSCCKTLLTRVFTGCDQLLYTQIYIKTYTQTYT